MKTVAVGGRKKPLKKLFEEVLQIFDSCSAAKWKETTQKGQNFGL